MLELVFILPLLGLFVILITYKENIVRLLKKALIWSLLTLTILIILWVFYDV